MAIDCRCPSCGANLKVAEKHAGRPVPCPKCAGVVTVPGAEAPGQRPPAEPRVPPRRRPPPTAADSPADAVEATGDGDRSGASTDRLPEIKVDPQTGPLAARRGRRKARAADASKSGRLGRRPVWLLAGGVSVAVLVAVIAVLLFSGDRSQSILVLDWPAEERSGGTVSIDGRQQRLPPSGPVEFALKPGPHRVVMRRWGYEQIEATVSLEANDRHHYEPRWRRSEAVSSDPGRISTAPGAWLQDMEVAQRQAAGQRDLLIAFEGSDSQGTWTQARREVLSQREFREQLGWRFVLVRIDFPRKTETPAQIEDPRRNRQLAAEYHVGKEPLVVLADARGRPYAVERVVEGRDVEAWVQRLARWQDDVGWRLSSLLRRAEDTTGDEQLAAIDEAAALLTRGLLRKMELARFYESTFEGWRTKGAREAAFSVSWMARLAGADEKDAKQIRRVVAELDRWKQEHELQDPNRAALMHAFAALHLALVAENSEGQKHVKAASAYGPEDPLALFMLAQAELAVSGYDPDSSTGTGFVVAADGHVLTNHHVIEGGSTISVRLPGGKRALPAKVLARDGERDIALLKIEVPEGIELKALHLAVTDVRRGAGVAAFGYPGGEALGEGLKLTTGVISALPDQRQDKMYLLDCLINPGNSGGPLCDTRGNVIGMVTAKIGAGLGVDSYGMALPAKDLQAFLKKHLPRHRQEAAQPGQARREWDEVDQEVSPSVVMVFNVQ